MIDLHKIAKRIMRMIHDKETNNALFVRDSETLAALVLSIKELTTDRFK